MHATSYTNSSDLMSKWADVLDAIYEANLGASQSVRGCGTPTSLCQLVIDKPLGFIDTDCLRDLHRVSDAGDFAGIYTGIQKLTSATFQAALSTAAKKEWM